MLPLLSAERLLLYVSLLKSKFVSRDVCGVSQFPNTPFRPLSTIGTSHRDCPIPPVEDILAELMETMESQLRPLPKILCAHSHSSVEPSSTTFEVSFHGTCRVSSGAPEHDYDPYTLELSLNLLSFSTHGSMMS